MFYKILLAFSFLLFGCNSSYKTSREIWNEKQSIKKQHILYEAMACHLDDLVDKNGGKSSAKDILTIIETAEKTLPVEIPDGGITLVDLLTIAMVETMFNASAYGSFKEIGVFQILKPELYDKEANPWDVEVNTKMAIMCIRDKYNTHKSKRKSVIGYNGLVKDKNGKWKSDYWDKFQKIQFSIEGALARARQDVENRNTIK